MNNKFTVIGVVTKLVDAMVPIASKRKKTSLSDAIGTIASTKPAVQQLPRPSNNASAPKPEKMVIVKDADDVADFGGELLSDAITHGGLSSRDCDERNSRERFKQMLSRENTLVAVIEEHKDLRGFFTQKEDSPWIQLNLDKPRTITGLQIDALPDWMYRVSSHLRVWTSEDGKIWREVAAENQRKHRYRFDLQRKNVTAKYIRVGREPGYMKNCFSLNKILVYGKEIKGK